MNTEKNTSNFFQKMWEFRGVKIALISLACLIILGGSVLGGARIMTPNNIADPKTDHYHFRFQYIYHGKAENFADSKYQTPYTKDICDGGLTNLPVHFHDQKDQLVHIHWRDMTGGEFLKIYGVNQIGGMDNYLGIRFNELNKFTLKPVPIIGNLLPKPNTSDKLYIYTGDREKFTKKDISDFKTKTIEEFVGVDSLIRKQFEENDKEKSKTGWLSGVNVLAHNGVDDGDGDKNEVRGGENTVQSETNSEEKLKQINNLIGNIVIFVQDKEPSQEEIKNRFNNLVQLETSSCGG